MDQEGNTKQKRGFIFDNKNESLETKKYYNVLNYHISYEIKIYHLSFSPKMRGSGSCTVVALNSAGGLLELLMHDFV